MMHGREANIPVPLHAVAELERLGEEREVAGLANPWIKVIKGTRIKDWLINPILAQKPDFNLYFPHLHEPPEVKMQPNS